MKKPVALRENEKGEPVDFVQTGKNHHLAIYVDDNGNRFPDSVSFFKAVERKRLGMDVVQLEMEGYRLAATFAINDLFVIGLDPAEVDFFDARNKSLISKHLYRVQKTRSDGKSIDIVFRHHLMSRIEKDDKEKETFKKLKIFLRVLSVKGLEGTKVFINRLGEITGIGETLKKQV